MTQDDMLIDLSGKVERDAWSDLVHTPRDPISVRNACQSAAELFICREITIQHGCTRQQAASFIRGADELAADIDALGRHCLRCSVLCTWSKQVDEFAEALLNLMVTDDA